MVQQCYRCNKRHNDINWQTQILDGVLINICSGHFKPKNPEFVPEYLKKDRDENAKSTLQPWREGYASAEFIEAYPKQAEKMFTLKERMTAKEVWKGDISSSWRKSR